MKAHTILHITSYIRLWALYQISDFERSENKNQAVFRKSCTSQILNLAQRTIDDGYETKKITGAVFVDLSVTYDTVSHNRLLRTIVRM